MKETIKKRALLVRDFILARGKIVFPILLIAAVAITVAIVLQVKGKEKEEQNVAMVRQLFPTETRRRWRYRM